ncbi:tyrosine-protein phosphatase [Mucilaginibacter sp. UR6-11]|uniref:tyrosine-protein phosphatase n=1 Tax=Mucilaginibacter sp. UR6-11 TaxID=1435644 RepID=UPI001E509B32|nr:CpsB/CapC family capsule biosynthesis tyrosine phosphatase [Mucilaginibacter sp. UR6-11]MCC8425425.1 capsular biosynthesis protein [Mucilaginibacter sp. UR6-11]
MLNFFKKKEEKKIAAFNYDLIAVDMHSHVLPGIDDGAQTVEESVYLIKKMMDVGIKKIIATPHIMVDFYRNTPETINGALEILKAELKKQNIDIEIEAAAEHYFDETFEKRVEEKKLMTMGDNYALFEYSFISPPPNAFEVIQKMMEWGSYKPILAHPERYPYMTVEEMANLRGWGCNMQLNTISLTGYYGKDVKKKAESMVDNDIVDFISSDMHHPKHAAAFKDALNYPHLEKLLFNYPLKNIMLK